MSGPPEPVFFTDRDLGRRFAESLRDAGLSVERHDQHFRPDTPDEHWLQSVGRRGWVAVTRDARIRYSPLALRVLMENDAKLLVIVGQLSNEQAATVFIRSRRRLATLCHTERGAFIAKVRRDRVFLWLRQSDWARRTRSA